MVAIRKESFERLAKVGAHERKLRAYFGPEMVFEGTEPLMKRPLILIAFTNRSGSNYLGELMCSTDAVMGMGEGLNDYAVIRRAEKWGITSFPEYFVKLQQGRRRLFGLKASWDQILMLLRCRIDKLYPRVKIVHIHRRSRVEQAISREIAWQTQKWTSFSKVETVVEPVYDEKGITRHLEAVQSEEEMFPLIFEAFGLGWTDVAYEDLVADPTGEIRRVMEWLKLPISNDWSAGETRMQKQANATNIAFKDAYMEAVRLRSLRK